MQSEVGPANPYRCRASRLDERKRLSNVWVALAGQVDAELLCCFGSVVLVSQRDRLDRYDPVAVSPVFRLQRQ